MRIFVTGKIMTKTDAVQEADKSFASVMVQIVLTLSFTYYHTHRLAHHFQCNLGLHKTNIKKVYHDVY